MKDAGFRLVKPTQVEYVRILHRGGISTKEVYQKISNVKVCLGQHLQYVPIGGMFRYGTFNRKKETR